MRFKRLRNALAILGVLAAGCGDDDNGTAKVSVLLTDAAGDVKAAVVTISEVYLVGGSNGKFTISTDPVTVDLITLANTAGQLVSDAVLDAGTYTELRFVISGAYIEVENEQGGTSIYASSDNYAGLPDGAVVTGPLEMPSLASSGLKVDFASNVVLEGDTDLLVDFDVSQSFGHTAGDWTKWVMHPVIKGASLSAAGTVEVNVSLDNGVTLPGGATLADFEAQVGTETQAFTDTDGDGVYSAEFKYLLPADYEVSIVPPAGLIITADPGLSVNKTVTAGATITADFTVLTAIAAP